MKGFLYLEDGSVYEGNIFGKEGVVTGEIVFNTAMTGYEEILTDPSYAGQIINMTYPNIGNYGTNSFDMESNKIYAKGLVVRNLCNIPSHYMSEENIDEFLKRMNVVGIHGVDTRSITKKIRDVGTMKCVISNKEMSVEELKNNIDSYQWDLNFVEMVSRKSIEEIQGTGPRIGVMDFGIKGNIIEKFKKLNCNITLLPWNTTFEEIDKLNLDGIFLSNGPGDPEVLKDTVKTVKSIIKKYPTFGICLGHQIIALALGGNTYKMKYGHRGGNHGIYDVERDKTFIASQNHSYAVDRESIKDKSIIVTHYNLNDNTVEGIKHKSLPVFSVQFHPEGSAGPEDTDYLFHNFIKNIKINKVKKSA
ncbi:glutamine-hydrolyzing carbamoyl-phosphate synthase small subunit [Clostridium sp. MSJ-11]|uniref:Carbamoyl phosphate synthase small chain n=1 Tax=Clostridium mobile TaxID=2841512 RepID=A0ABS6EJI1_9CLOT|nr:glutamine-hydrolyzing carbamoyl-phosphate synthase small subunit [Clostridium mobile]MBU5485388.1 glutamine-hydrolyzing carbamoyl-phosphate synthase small subunit [Clostridium mobile]